MTTGDGPNAIEISGLSKSFGRTPVLHDLDLTVPWGQVLTVLGPNGSGKTTLIRVLAGLTSPDEGVARIGGADLSKRGRRTRRLVGVVTHDPLMYDELTAHENLRFHARMFGLDRADERIADATERLGMAARLHQKVGTLSHGMRKRFSIARALLHEPSVLLMDEPESGLDQEALGLLDELIADRSVAARTVLMTTHNLDRGIELADRVAIIARGRIAHDDAVDTPADAAGLRDAYFELTGAAR